MEKYRQVVEKIVRTIFIKIKTEFYYGSFNQFQEMSYCMCPQNINGQTFKGFAKLALISSMNENSFQHPIFVSTNTIRNHRILISENAAKITLPNNQILYNIEQTNLKEIAPDFYAQLTGVKNFWYDKQAEIYCSKIENILKSGKWVCAIKSEKTMSSCYSTNTDTISIPDKSKFCNSIEYYSTLIHECCHSVGKYLGRDMNHSYGELLYAKEEVVSEITSMVICMYLGVSVNFDRANLAYVQSWYNYIKSSGYDETIISDVVNAFFFMMNIIDDEFSAVVRQKTNSKPQDSTRFTGRLF